MSVTRDGDFSLNEEQVCRFHEQGFLGPFTAVKPSEMRELREYVDTNVLGSDDGPWEGVPEHDRHRDHEPLYDLYTNPAIVERMASLYGDCFLWATRLWNKEPGDPQIPWHQDVDSSWTTYIEPPVNVSAWIAIDEATAENGCVKLVPGSHRSRVDTVAAPDETVFEVMADTDEFDPDQAVEMELEPGQFFLFNERTIHKSDRNMSDDRRLGTSMRAVPSFVNVSEDELYEGYAATPLHGDADWGINRIERPFDD